MDLLGTAQAALRRVVVARGAHSGHVRVRGHRVHHFYVRGDQPGTPVVLVHGLAADAATFSRSLFGLARRFPRVYAVDLPGNGFSPIPDGGPVSLREQFEVLIEYCRDVVREPAFVVGNSLGGAMSVVLAQEQPALVRALGLVAPAGASLTDAQRAGLVRLFNVESAAQARELTRKLFHQTPWYAWPFGGELMKLYANPAARKVFADVQVMEHLQPDVLAGLAMPTLLLWGRAEKVLPYDGIDYFRAHLPPHAEVEVLDKWGHVPQMERPREFVDRLVRFADRHRF